MVMPVQHPVLLSLAPALGPFSLLTPCSLHGGLNLGNCILRRMISDGKQLVLTHPFGDSGEIVHYFPSITLVVILPEIWLLTHLAIPFDALSHFLPQS